MLKPLLSICFLAVLTCDFLANPLANHGGDDDGHHGGSNDDRSCLTQEQGDRILSTWISFFVNPVEADIASHYLTPDIHLYSESTNSVTPGKGDTPAKTSAPLATDIPSFIALQSMNNGSVNFDVIAKAYACDAITVRWQTTNFSPFLAGEIDFLGGTIRLRLPTRSLIVWPSWWVSGSFQRVVMGLLESGRGSWIAW